MVREKITCGIVVWVLPFAGILLNGCGGGKGDGLDPTQIGRFRPLPSVNVILDTLGVAEESTNTYKNAEEPRPIDLIEFKEDHVIKPGDILQISIFELFTEGVQFEKTYVVTETGKISIPEVGHVQAAGMNEAQLENEIKQILSPSILKEPAVSVIMLSSENRTFTILGAGIPKPNRYAIPRDGLRLAEALATAGSPDQFNVSHIYVTRALTGREEFLTPPAADVNAVLPEPPEQVEPEQQIEPTKQYKMEEMLEVIAPDSGRDNRTGLLLITPSETATDKELQEAAMSQLLNPSEIMTDKRIEHDELVILQDFEPDRTIVDNPSRDNREQLLIETAGPTELIIQNNDVEIIDQREAEGAEQKQKGPETIADEQQQEQPERVEWIYRDGRWVPARENACCISRRFGAVGLATKG